MVLARSDQEMRAADRARVRVRIRVRVRVSQTKILFPTTLADTISYSKCNASKVAFIVCILEIIYHFCTDACDYKSKGYSSS